MGREKGVKGSKERTHSPPEDPRAFVRQAKRRLVRQVLAEKGGGTFVSRREHNNEEGEERYESKGSKKARNEVKGSRRKKRAEEEGV